MATRLIVTGLSTLNDLPTVTTNRWGGLASIANPGIQRTAIAAITWNICFPRTVIESAGIAGSISPTAT
jgi:hypothetical protein